MNKDLEFILKVVRNGFILAGLYFVSVFAVGDLSYDVLKPIVVFLLTYVFTECARYYKLDTTQIKKNSKPLTLFF